MPVNLIDIAVSKIGGVDYSCIIKRISQSDDVNLLENVDLIEERGVL